MFSLKVLILIVSLVVFIIFFKTFRKKNIFGLQGKLVYLDEGKKSKAFVNHKFKIIAKPDFIFKHWWGQFYMIEHKESFREPNRADIVLVFFDPDKVSTSILERILFCVPSSYIGLIPTMHEAWNHW